MIFNNRSAIVTGASSPGGIGEAVAHYLAGSGCKVAVVGRNEDRTINVAKHIVACGGTAVGIPADVSRPEDTKRVADETIKAFGKIDILVNLAGIGLDLFLDECTVEDFHRLVDNNVTSMFLMVKAVVPDMIKNHYGKIINMASGSGKAGGSWRGGSIYSATKSANIAFTRAAASELIKHNILVNAVSPCGVHTPMIRDSLFYKQNEAEGWKDWPFHRMAVPQDIASAIGFLASEENQYIAGEDINITGGTIMC